METPINSEVNDVISFFKDNKIKCHANRVKESRHWVIDFVLELKSFTKPNKIESEFSFELHVKTNFLGKLYFEIISKKNHKIPFHPNFRINYRGLMQRPTNATWVLKHDPNRPRPISMIDSIKEMILALQFNSDFIELEETRAANLEALKWCTKKNMENHKLFPTDNHFEFPDDVDKEKNKSKFEIQSTQSVDKKKRKFNIVKESNYEKKKQLIDDLTFITDKNLSSIANNSSNSKLYITTRAKGQMWDHIKWGDLETRSNKVEQGGVMLGKVYFDPIKKIQFGIVEQIVYSINAQGNAVHLEMNHETWSEMLNKADKIIDQEGNEGLQIIGWYHTHPNELPVFMSETDLNTQNRFFNQEWHFAIVLNPHKKNWKAFVGKEAIQCEGYFTIDKDEEDNVDKIDSGEIHPKLPKNKIIVSEKEERKIEKSANNIWKQFVNLVFDKINSVLPKNKNDLSILVISFKIIRETWAA